MLIRTQAASEGDVPGALATAVHDGNAQVRLRAFQLVEPWVQPGEGVLHQVLAARSVVREQPCQADGAGVGGGVERREVGGRVGRPRHSRIHAPSDAADDEIVAGSIRPAAPVERGDPKAPLSGL